MAYATVTTVGHAETGRLWQSRAFWENADAALHAGGELTALHDAYRAAVAALGGVPETPEPPAPPRPPARPAPPAVLVSVVLCWSDGTVTTVAPPAQALGTRGDPPPATVEAVVIPEGRGLVDRDTR